VLKRVGSVHEQTDMRKVCEIGSIVAYDEDVFGHGPSLLVSG
jgi:hypothetical protein